YDEKALTEKILSKLTSSSWEWISVNDASSSIFIEDEEDQVEMKINRAHCTEGIVEGNPCLEYIKHIIFPWFQEFEVERFEEHGGNKTFKNLEDLITDYQKKKLHPADLKLALDKELNRILKVIHLYLTLYAV
ncbi:hypothetical protein C5167_035687, partial [Papaver somniferum]